MKEQCENDGSRTVKNLDHMSGLFTGVGQEFKVGTVWDRNPAVKR